MFFRPVAALVRAVISSSRSEGERAASEVPPKASPRGTRDAQRHLCGQNQRFLASPINLFSLVSGLTVLRHPAGRVKGSLYGRLTMKSIFVSLAVFAVVAAGCGGGNNNAEPTSTPLAIATPEVVGTYVPPEPIAVRTPTAAPAPTDQPRGCEETHDFEMLSALARADEFDDYALSVWGYEYNEAALSSALAAAGYSQSDPERLIDAYLAAWDRYSAALDADWSDSAAEAAVGLARTLADFAEVLSVMGSAVGADEFPDSDGWASGLREAADAIAAACPVPSPADAATPAPEAPVSAPPPTIECSPLMEHGELHETLPVDTDGDGEPDSCEGGHGHPHERHDSTEQDEAPVVVVATPEAVQPPERPASTPVATPAVEGPTATPEAVQPPVVDPSPRMRLLSYAEIVSAAPQLEGWAQDYAPRRGDNELAVGACVERWEADPPAVSAEDEYGWRWLPSNALPAAGAHEVCSTLVRMAWWPIDFALGDPECVHRVIADVMVWWRLDNDHPLPAGVHPAPVDESETFGVGWAERCGSLLYPEPTLPYPDACFVLLRNLSPDWAAVAPSGVLAHLCDTQPSPEVFDALGGCASLVALRVTAFRAALNASDDSPESRALGGPFEVRLPFLDEQQPHVTGGPFDSISPVC